MARTEVIAKRGPRSKTFDNGDGTFALEVGGGIAHHQKDGAWVETDITWKNSATELLTGEWPGQVKVNKGTRAITLLPQGATVPITLAPLGHNKKAPAPTYEGNRITFTGLWTGIDLNVYLTPEGIALHYTKTAHPCANPGWTLPGEAAAFLRGGESYMSEGEDGLPVVVPHTLANGMYTLDFATAPVGAVVS